MEYFIHCDSVKLSWAQFGIQLKIMELKTKWERPEQPMFFYQTVAYFSAKC
jgi:hypothetical protein